jgi:hypothetical protein
MSTDGTSPRTRSALLILVLAVATALFGLTANPGVSAQVAAQCDTDTVEVGIVKATGCFTKRVPNGDTDPVFDTTAAFRMNGFDVAPHAGTTVTFTPAAGKRGASVTTNNGFVDLTATSKSGKWGTIHFNNMVFSFTPPKTGEVVIATSALAQPLPVITGLTPLAVSQPITLTDEGAKFDLSFSVGSFFLELVSGSEKEMAASIGFEVQDGKFSIASGKFSVGKFTLAKLLTVNEGSLEIGADKFDIDGDGVFTAVSGFGVVFGTTIEGNQMKRATLGISEINKPLGSSGVYLQKLAVSLFPSPPYGGSGTIGLSAGPKTSFFGRKVTAVEAEGTVEVRGEDTTNRKPAYFTVGGKFSLMTLPVGNASFSYYFGQGTRMSANVGIGLPSGTNDPNQPTYVGGGFSGWTSAQHFDLEGDAKLKLLGIDLLGAKTVVSDIGFAGCLQVVAWIGGGVRWSDGRGELLGGWTCNIGGYQPQPGAAQKMNDGQMRMRLDDEVRVIRVRAPEGEPAPQIQFSQRGGAAAFLTCACRRGRHATVRGRGVDQPRECDLPDRQGRCDGSVDVAAVAGIQWCRDSRDCRSAAEAPGRRVGDRKRTQADAALGCPRDQTPEVAVLRDAAIGTRGADSFDRTGERNRAVHSDPRAGHLQQAAPDLGGCAATAEHSTRHVHRGSLPRSSTGGSRQGPRPPDPSPCRRPGRGLEAGEGSRLVPR